MGDKGGAMWDISVFLLLSNLSAYGGNCENLHQQPMAHSTHYCLDDIDVSKMMGLNRHGYRVGAWCSTF